MNRRITSTDSPTLCPSADPILAQYSQHRQHPRCVSALFGAQPNFLNVVIAKFSRFPYAEVDVLLHPMVAFPFYVKLTHHDHRMLLRVLVWSGSTHEPFLFGALHTHTTSVWSSPHASQFGLECSTQNTHMFGALHTKPTCAWSTPHKNHVCLEHSTRQPPVFGTAPHKSPVAALGKPICDFTHMLVLDFSCVAWCLY